MNIYFKGLSAAFITIFSSLHYMSAPKKSSLGGCRSPFSRLKPQIGNILLKKLSHHSLHNRWSTERSSLFFFDESTGSALFTVASKRSLGYVQIFPTFGIPNFSLTLRHMLAQIPYQLSLTTSPHGLDARLIFFNTSNQLKNINLHQYHIIRKKAEKIIPEPLDKKSLSILEASVQSKETLSRVKRSIDRKKIKQGHREEVDLHRSSREEGQNGKKEVSRLQSPHCSFYENSENNFPDIKAIHASLRKARLSQEQEYEDLEDSKQFYHTVKNEVQTDKEMAAQIISELEKHIEGLGALRNRKVFGEGEDLEEWKILQDFFGREIEELTEDKNHLKNVLKKAENIELIDGMALLIPEIKRCKKRWYDIEDPKNKNEFEEMYRRWTHLRAKETQLSEQLAEELSEIDRRSWEIQEEHEKILALMKSSP